MDIIKEIQSIAIPSSISQLSVLVQEVTDNVIIGNFNDPELIDGLGMGQMMRGLVIFSILNGMAQSLDYQVSQAAGSGRRDLVNIYQNRSLFLVTLIFIPIVIIACNTKSILTLIGQDDKTASIAQIQCVSILPGQFLFFYVENYIKVFNNYKKTYISTICGWTMTLSHIIYSYLLVIYLDRGLIGSAISYNLAQFTKLIILEVVLYLQENENIDLFERNHNVFNGLLTQILDCMRFSVLYILEGWAFQASIMISGWVGLKEQAAWLIAMSMMMTFIGPSNGFDTSTCVLVGNEIGKMNVKQAYTYFRQSILTQLINQAVFLLIWTFLFDIQMRMQTQNKELLEIGHQLKQFMMVEILFDTGKLCMKGTIKALGIQDRAILVNLVVYWIITPFVYYLLIYYMKLGLLGVLCTQIVKECLAYFSWCSIILCSDWVMIAETASERRKLNSSVKYIDEMEPTVMTVTDTFDNNLSEVNLDI